MAVLPDPNPIGDRARSDAESSCRKRFSTRAMKQASLDMRAAFSKSNDTADLTALTVTETPVPGRRASAYSAEAQCRGSPARGTQDQCEAQTAKCFRAVSARSARYRNGLNSVRSRHSPKGSDQPLHKRIRRRNVGTVLMSVTSKTPRLYLPPSEIDTADRDPS